jgi:hypothetical protein
MYLCFFGEDGIYLCMPPTSSDRGATRMATDTSEQDAWLFHAGLVNLLPAEMSSWHESARLPESWPLCCGGKAREVSPDN